MNENITDIREEVIEGGYDEQGDFHFAFKVPKDARWMRLYEDEDFREFIEEQKGSELNRPFYTYLTYIRLHAKAFLTYNAMLFQTKYYTEEEKKEIKKQLRTYLDEINRRVGKLHPPQINNNSGYYS